MTNLQRLLIALMALMSASWVPSIAAEIDVMDVGTGTTAVFLRGEIVEGDADRFYSAVSDAGHAMVTLDSPGGLVAEALSIGALIAERQFATYVPPDVECASACALIWLAGERRRMSDRSLVGFHAAYRLRDGQATESGMANAEIGAYLTHLGLPVEAVRYITVSAPDEMMYLTTADAVRFGFDVYVDERAPQFQPSGPTLVWQSATLVMAANNCGDFYGTAEANLMSAGRDRLSLAHELYGAEASADRLSMTIDAVKNSWETTRSAIRWCSETAQRLFAQSVPVFPDGPSYSCEAAATATERAICSNSNLALSDRIVAAMYRYYRGVPDEEVVTYVKSSQREWVSARNQCGGDTSCLFEAYGDRVHQLMP